MSVKFQNECKKYLRTMRLAKYLKPALIIMVIALFNENIAQASTVTEILKPTEDSYVRDGSYANQNYGAETLISVKDNTTNGYNRKAYLKFDVSKIVDPVKEAKLRIYGKTSSGICSVKVYSIIDNNWTERGITWNNAPIVDVNLGVWSVSTSAKYYELNLTSLINNKNSGLISVSIQSDAKEDLNTNFNSRENTTNQPQLVLSYDLTPPPITTDVYFRLNQIGYALNDIKTALILTKNNLNGQSINILDNNNNIVFSAPIVKDKGTWGTNFNYVYEFDFTGLKQSGTYKINYNGAISPEFKINSDVFNYLIPLSLEFFSVQRCGNTNPEMHGPCHVSDGKVSNGVNAGKIIDVSGGWHDAADFIKFLNTISYTADMLLATYLRHPNVFSSNNSNDLPEVLNQVKIALDFALKMWDNTNQVLYYQVADGKEHGRFIMPENDNYYNGPRPVYACDNGKGANIAGKTSAALAMAYIVWNDSSKLYYNSSQALVYLAAAEQIYQWGKKRPAVQKLDYYGDMHWEEDMALAAAELYRATGVSTYLAEAKAYANLAGDWTNPTNHHLDWSNNHALASYEVARLDVSYKSTVITRMNAHLKMAQNISNSNTWEVGISDYHWGGNETMCGIAMEAYLYEDLSGNSTYRLLAKKQTDYIFGRNPWGVCFVNSAGTIWPHHPRHRVAYLTGQELRGFWDEGPVSLAEYISSGAQDEGLDGPDIYAKFQTDKCVFHDDRLDYATNEPTISANAAGVALAGWLCATQ